MKTAAIPLHTAPSDDQSIGERLVAAALHCQSRSQRLTEQRKEVLALLLQHGGCVKAYDLLDELKRTHPHAGPPAVYRPLRFLVAVGLAHRVESLNAYVACTSHDHHDLLVVCPRCTAVAELADGVVSKLLKNRLHRSGFVMQDRTVEINALCGSCAATSQDALSTKTRKPSNRNV